jgi:hypothetical protein
VDPHPTWFGPTDLGALAELTPYAAAAFTLWFVNMAVTGWLAGRRGRDDGLWTFIALILGPIALVAVAILPPRPKPEVLDGLPVAPATYSGEWPVLSAPPPAITQAQRLLGASLGAGVGAMGAGILVGLGNLAAIEAHLIVGAASGFIVGYVLSNWLIEADRTKVIGVGAAAGVLVLSVAGLLIAIVNGLRGLLTGAMGIEVIPFALVVAVLYPITYALFAQGVLAVSISGAAIWAAATYRLLRLRRARSAHASPSAG